MTVIVAEHKHDDARIPDMADRCDKCCPGAAWA
ncbi:MAG: hypothetical protein HLUCCA12_07755 [Rhodobacteraceae bacterium HLUCCA12]|nr:MAG: hypothetical protein HLUCCA12_07755 [Rhodobacteraceae bacterium HLUCCA12]